MYSRKTKQELYDLLYDYVFSGLSDEELTTLIDNEVDTNSALNTIESKKSYFEEKATALLASYEDVISNEATEIANQNIIESLNGRIKNEVGASYNSFLLEYKKDTSFKKRIIDGVAISMIMLVLWFLFTIIYSPKAELVELTNTIKVYFTSQTDSTKTTP